MSQIKYTNCTSCNAPIIHVINEKTKLPSVIDAKPTNYGNIVVNLTDEMNKEIKLDSGHYRVLNKQAIEYAKQFKWDLYQSHFILYPFSKNHRRGK